MTLPESAINQLVTLLASNENTSHTRQIVEWAMNQLIEAEATETIGAEPWERTPGRTTQRNGYRTREPWGQTPYPTRVTGSHDPRKHRSERL